MQEEWNVVVRADAEAPLSEICSAACVSWLLLEFWFRLVHPALKAVVIGIVSDVHMRGRLLDKQSNQRQSIIAMIIISDQSANM